MKNNQCNICPRKCKIDRTLNVGFCNEKETIKIAKTIKNFKWEEPCLADDRGTFAIFFSGCNLRCDYCQNYQISRGSVGQEFSIDEFCKLIEENQNLHSSIDLITPTHFSKQLIEAFRKIDKKIPIIWNTNGYETVETIQNVSSFVDVFLTDLKYSNDQLGKKFSKCSDYFSHTLPAIKSMCNLKPDIEENDILKQGVIIRHLVLPNHITNSFDVLDIIKKEFPTRKISIMSQFTPNGQGELNRKLTKIEYKAVLSHLKKLNLQNGFIQDFESADNSFVPNFD
ncbi:MAG: radical SAM protein [Clostridiales bacterium]|nr:radical SAM protein [Clostridiales bacterium]